MWETIIPAAATLIAGGMNNASRENANSQNYASQKEFAKMGIRWKVADAKAAGIHPLAALGANTVSFQPSIAGNDYSYLSDMGQDIGRAVAAKQTQGERQINKQILEEQLKGLKIENMARLKMLNDGFGGNIPPTPAVGPRTNSDGIINAAGTGNNPGVEYPTMQKPPTVSAKSGASPGAEPALDVVNMPGGGQQVFLSEKLQEQFEDGVTAEIYKAIFDFNKLLATKSPEAIKEKYKTGRIGFKKIWTAIGPAWKAYKIKGKPHKETTWYKRQLKDHDFQRSYRRTKLPGVGKPTIRGY